MRRTILLAAILSVEPALCAPAARVHEPFDIVLASQKSYANPYREVRLEASLTGPSGRRIRTAGFHADQGKWVVRMAFDEPGAWQVATRSEPPDPAFATTREVQVGPAVGPGPVRIDAKRLGFVTAGGAPFFHLGDTCYVLLALDRDRQRLPYLRRRAAQGFSHVRFHAVVAETRFPQLWAWGGTYNSPDLDRFNPAYFDRMDELMRDVRAAGLRAEIILENFYHHPMSRPELWTREREEAWLRCLVARYFAFDTVLYWTLANEFETYPDGKYRLDDPGDIEWARRTARFVKSIDPYRHPVTVHPFLSLEKYLGWFGAAPEIDLVMAQEHGEEREISKAMFDGSGAGLEEKVRQARKSGKPVAVGESGYEWDGATTRGVNVSSDLARRHAWRIAMGGGHVAAGFRSTVFNFPGMTFDIENGGRPAAGRLSTMARFFRERTQFLDLVPRFELVQRPALCLAGEGELVVYAPEGGKVELDLREAAGQAFTSTWLDPLEGEYRTGPRFTGGARRTAVAPWPEFVLHLKRAGVSTPAK